MSQKVLKIPVLEPQAKVRLLPWQPENAAYLLKWAEMPSMAEFFRHLPPTMALMSPASLGALQSVSWAIYREDELVGLFMVTDQNQQAQSCSISILVDWADSKERRRIVCSVTEQAADYLYNYLNYNKVSCKLLETRTDIRKCLESYGFQLEATLINSAKYRGVFWNEWLLSCFKETFQWDKH